MAPCSEIAARDEYLSPRPRRAAPHRCRQGCGQALSRDEIKWEWIDEAERTITLPASLTKNKRTHKFPYGRIVAEILERLPQQGEYLFPAARDQVKGKPATVFNGWGKPKATFDDLCNVSNWQLHDLRRTFATNLASLGVAPHVVERILNQSSGTISGVAAIYNQFKYMDEMRAAIEIWEQRLNKLLT
jgi:integrase